MDLNAKAEVVCATATIHFLKQGATVLTPVGHAHRYDLVVEKDGVFTRVQCKHGRIKNGGVIFNTCSSQHERGRGRTDYRGSADIFAVGCTDTNKLYVIPVDDVGCTAVCLRLEPTKNNQSKGVRWASSYEV